MDGHKVIQLEAGGGERINKISSTYFHTLPKTYGKIFITPFYVSEYFHTPPPCVSLLKHIQYSTIIIKCNFFRTSNYNFGTPLEVLLVFFRTPERFFHTPKKYPPHLLVNTGPYKA